MDNLCRLINKLTVGINSVTICLLENCAYFLFDHLYFIENLAIKTSSFPFQCEKARIFPAFITEKKNFNCRSLDILSDSISKAFIQPSLRQNINAARNRTHTVDFGGLCSFVFKPRTFC